MATPNAVRRVAGDVEGAGAEAGDAGGARVGND